ncbi:tRNA-splicing endonuclease subunit Sen2-2 [Drosophila santomea]|uniref:tRNA-splicing endonuclease subunit Sen2-2 n=1 Tax=Drosophila santomea TaxID=129105 RepID=UPI0019536093|nr:tRNA-splicing endonuclease subunit Sen2-2 [Drosophila santomea]
MLTLRMQLTFACKRKRCSNKNVNSTPLPSCQDGERYKGRFTGLSVEIVDPEQAKSLYDNGCFGKGSKSRGAPESGDEDETLLLGMEESCFLAHYLKVLDIRNSAGCFMDFHRFVEVAKEQNDKFLENLASYVYFKSKNWVIKSGIKFGGDFLIYKQSPRLYHASFLVIVQKPGDSDHYQSKNLKGVQRVAETSDKDVLLLTVQAPKDISCPRDLQEATVTETIVRRFNYLTFVQSKQQ